jgi:hypothetical protein
LMYSFISFSFLINFCLDRFALFPPGNDNQKPIYFPELALTITRFLLPFNIQLSLVYIFNKIRTDIFKISTPTIIYVSLHLIFTRFSPTIFAPTESGS